MNTRLFSLAFTLVAAACGGGYATGPSTSGGPVATTSVELKNIAFAPAAIRVAAGATVTFTNNDGVNHNVTFTESTVTSVGNFASGARQVVMPQTTGTYAYHCTIHPSMQGTVLVQ